MTFRRRTLAAPAILEGRGLHGGDPVTLTIHPAEDGIHFRVGASRIAARPENVTDTSRSTRLGDAGTIEHVMSALAGMEITDAEIELTAPECPGLDGSALPYVEAIRTAGTVDLEPRALPNLFSRVFRQEDGGVSVAIAKGGGHWRYVYDVGDRWPGRCAYETEDILGGYVAEVAPARTFYLLEEIPMIEKAGLGRGLDEHTTFCLGYDRAMGAVRFPDDEAPRHKLLDLIGDLYLAGVPIRFLSVVAEKSGHRLNVAAAARLAAAVNAPSGT